MKGKIVSVKHRVYEYQGTQREVWDVVVDLGDKKKKYNCSSKLCASFVEGQEIEYQEEAGKEYTDNEGTTRQNWKMILPKGSGGSPFQGGGGWKGKSKEELLQGMLTMTFAYANQLSQSGIEHKLINDMADAQKWTIDSFELFVPVIRKVYLSILEAEQAK